MKRRFALPGFIGIMAIVSVTMVGMASGKYRSHSGRAASVAGSYYCYPDCGGNTPILLSANGNWQWGGFNVGTFQVSNGSVVFDGVGGPATWGPAAAGEDSLTFITPGPPESRVVYRKAGPIPSQLLGVYSGGGETALEFRADGSYVSQAPDGSGGYIVFGGNKVRFFGGSAAEWGAADISDGTLTFHPGGRLVGFSRIAEGTVWVYRKTTARALHKETDQEHLHRLFNLNTM
jgi:hypothetical protein